MAKWTDCHAENFSGTEKQYEILTKVLAAADLGAPISLIDLWRSLSWGATVTKQAVLCSIRILEHHGMVERRYGRKLQRQHRQGMPQYVLPTLKCYQLLRKQPAAV
jgi:hypothetical protein